MSVSSLTIKKTAKDIIKNNFINITVTTAIVMSVWFIVYNFAAIIQTFTEINAFIVVLLVLSLFVFTPLFMGYLRHLWRLISGVCDNPVSLFYYFSSRSLYFKVLKFTLSIVLRIAVCYFVFYIPVLVIELITGTWLYNTLNITMPMWTTSLSTITSILKFIAFVATVVSVLKFYLSPMLFVADDNMDTAEALHLSSVISKRTVLDFVFLALSFFGWLLLSFLSVPILFTLPYFVISVLIHSSFAVNTFNDVVSKTDYEDIPTFIAGA